MLPLARYRPKFTGLYRCIGWCIYFSLLPRKKPCARDMVLSFQATCDTGEKGIRRDKQVAVP